MRRVLALAVIAVMCFGVNAVQSQTPGGKKKNNPVPTELEKLHAEALKNNPDIRVAEAKLRLAEAQYMRERLRVLNKIANAYAEFEAARDAELEGRIRYVRAIKIWEACNMSDEKFGMHQASYLKLKAAYAQAERRFNTLIGRPVALKVSPAPLK